jgi:S1-C subfamily serine protease
VTLGIVSSLQRSAAEVGIPNKKVNFIQTDAAINPGNSGGPLLNEFGEVIGINTAIRANAAGIGFAIPIDTAEKAMRELSQGRKIAHAYLGISMSTLTPDSARQNNADPNSNVELPEISGALVLAVAPETPAAKAGFKKFDLIQELDGKAVKSAADAQSIVDNCKVGQSLVAKIIRGPKTLSLNVVTGDLNERPEKPASPRGAP